MDATGGSMKLDEFKVVMAQIKAYLPHAKVSKETKNAYWLKFKDMDGIKFANAVNKCIDQSDFFPTVHSILNNMTAEISIGEVISELRWIMRLYPGQTFSASTDIHPITRQVLNEIGGKMSLGQLTEDKLQYKVKNIYKYAIVGIGEDKPAQIGNRENRPMQLGEAIEFFKKL